MWSGLVLRARVEKSLTERKPKKCRICEREFIPFSTTSIACRPECAYELVKRKKAKKALNQVKDKVKFDKMMHRKAKESIKTKAKWLKEAQVEFNKFIRLRDHDKPCISCNRHHQGQYHAGHYKTTGSHPELRFEELNAHKQCAPCNNHKSGNIVDYRINLTKKLGSDNVDWLEKDHPPKNYTIDDIKEIKLKYRKKWKELEEKLC